MTYVTDRAKNLKIPVIDGDRPIAIAVTKHDVINALKSDSKRCALARAAERMPGVSHGYFFRSIAYLEYKDRMVRYILPPSVQKEIVSFDRAQIFAPGIYQLTPPGTYTMRRKNRDRTEELKRLKQRRSSPAKEPIKRERRPPASLPAYSIRATSGDGNAAEFMEKMAAVTQRALNGNKSSPGVARATKQPKSRPRMTIVNRTKYVRDIRDPDLVTR